MIHNILYSIEAYFYAWIEIFVMISATFLVGPIMSASLPVTGSSPIT